MKIKKVDALLVEDNPGDVRLLEEAFREASNAPISLTVAERLDRALELLATCNPDVVLLDLSLPDSHGLETFDRVREAVSELPVVILTGTDDEDLALRAVQKGAQDYLVKGEAHGSLLIRAVHYAIERNRLQHKVAEAQQHLLEAERLRVLIETAGAAAHEINQPLMAISGHIDLLLYSAAPDHPWRDDLQRIRNSAGRIHEIVKKMGEIQSYVTKPYVDDSSIVDFDASAACDET